MLIRSGEIVFPETTVARYVFLTLQMDQRTGALSCADVGATRKLDQIWRHYMLVV
jgi:hypothetical protein